ncbi:MAG: hypothetical protein U0835_11650 [Isosphaeraceae bacterium]
MMDTHDAPERCLDRRAFLRATVAAGASSLGLLGGPAGKLAHADETAKADRRVRVRVWCEATAPRTVYPGDVDGALSEHLSREAGLSVQRARLSDPAAGLSDERSTIPTCSSGGATCGTRRFRSTEPRPW